MEQAAQFREQLFAHGLLISTGVDGLYVANGIYEGVLEAIGRLVTRAGEDQNAEIMRFPPGMNRASFERSGYLKGFPTLVGTVHSFCGDEHGHRRLLECVATSSDWAGEQSMTDVVLTPAACYPAYPIVASRGAIPDEGITLDLTSYCFRREPSVDPGRQQMFRQREYVRIGSPQSVMAFRETWMQRAQDMAKHLGLNATLDVANDPFFGRAGRLMADSQREQKLKFELLIPVGTPDRPTACTSFNYHGDHFGTIWNFQSRNNTPVHTACVGFGMERLTLAMFRRHGFDPAAWPASVRETLWDMPQRAPAARPKVEAGAV